MLIYKNSAGIFNRFSFDLSASSDDISEYYFSILINSEHSNDLLFYISDKYVLSTKAYFTDSKTDDYGRILFDIRQRVNLSEGNYTIDISCDSIPSIYEIHINKYDSEQLTKYKFIDYNNFKLPDLNLITRFDKNKKEYLVISNVSARYGGFWWCVLQVIEAARAAEIYNLIPIIDYRGGLFSSNSIYDPELPESWWNCFFEDPIPVNQKEKEEILECAKKDRFEFCGWRRNPNRRSNQRFLLYPVGDNTVYYYTFNSFARMKVINNWERITMMNKFMKPHKYILDYCENFWNRYDISNNIVIGVHYRGTDKYGWGLCDEGKPIHYKYESVKNSIKKIIDEDKIENYLLYCASDEQPFIEYMKDYFNVVYNDHDLRSNESTDGKNFNFNLIGKEDNSEDYKDQKDKWTYVKSLSIHFGKKTESNFIKGFYSLTDCLLFSKCKYLFKSRGNFSDYAGYLCHGAKIYDLNSCAN
jgi:hypothetical protein